MNMDSIITTLLEQGTMVALMSAMLWILIKKLLNHLEDRIKTLENINLEWKKEIASLHQQIFDMQQEHIEALRKQNES